MYVYIYIHIYIYIYISSFGCKKKSLKITLAFVAK